MIQRAITRASVPLLLGLLLMPGRAGRADGDTTWIILGAGNRAVRQAGMGFLLFATADAPLVIPAALNPDTDADGMISEGPFPDCPHRFHFHGRMFDREDGGSDCGWGATIRKEDAPEPVSDLADGIDLELAAVSALLENPPDLGKARSFLDGAAFALTSTQESLEQDADEGTIRPQDARILGRALEGPARTDVDAGKTLERVQSGQARRGELERVQPRISGAIKKKRDTFRIIVKKYGLLQ